MKLVEEFKKEYRIEEENEVRQQEAKKDKETFSRELPEREYWKRIEEN